MLCSIAMDDVAFATDLVTCICSQTGPALAGTREEMARSALLCRELEAQVGHENVAVEPFELAPAAWLQTLPICSLAIAGAAVLNRIGGVVAPVLGLAISLGAVALFVVELVLGLELVDRWFPRRPSINVIGVLRGRGPIERVLAVAGHHDSAPENRWLALLGAGFVVASLIAFVGLFAIVAACAVQVAGLAAGNAALVRTGTIGAGLAIPIAAAIIYGLGFARPRARPGPDLTASALVVALCRRLVRDPGGIPDGVEVRFVSFGGAHAGLRGSRRYVARHQAELRALDARVLAIDAVSHPIVSILASDLHGVVVHDSTVVEAVVEAAQRADVPYLVKQAHVGIATDAASFTRNGIPATALWPRQGLRPPTTVDDEALAHVLAVAREWIHAGGEP
jgi:hypothetical protein